MNSPDQLDEKWLALLARCTPTFEGGTVPPYGFITATAAQLKAEKIERDLLEKIGLRALFASVAVLAAVAVISVSVQLHATAVTDFDPGIRSVLQADNVPIS